MKNNQLIIGIAVVVILLVLGGGYFLFANKGSQTEEDSQKMPGIVEEVIPTINPEDIGLSIEARRDNQAIRFIVAKPEGMESIEYELTYLSEGDIPRGATGNVMVEDDSEPVQSPYIDLGSCSSGTCKYDKGVHDIKILLKITKTDGKVFQAEKTFELE